MNADLDALATRLYVTIDDLLIDHPEWIPQRPAVGIVPQLSDAELLTLAVLQALLGYTSEERFIRHAHVGRDDPCTGQAFEFFPSSLLNPDGSRVLVS